MAIPHTEDFTAGNSVFTSMDVYDRTTDGPDTLYPDVNFAEGLTVTGAFDVLDWNGTYADYQSLSFWLQGMGSLNGGGAGAYAGAGFWNAFSGTVIGTYTPNATSLADISYAPLIWIPTPSAGSLLGVYWDAGAGLYEVERYTETGYAMTTFTGDGVVPVADVPLKVTLSWQCGTYPGVVPSEHDADGFLRVYLNDGLVYEETGIALYLTFSSSPVDLIDGVAFGYQGFLGALDEITIQGEGPAAAALTSGFAWGVEATVAGVSRAGCIALDGSPHTNSTPGTLLLGGDLYLVGALELTDGITAPAAETGRGRFYVDTADGDLKIIFGDGTIKTIVTDT